MHDDPMDVIFVEDVPEQRVSRRRHVTIGDQDWQQVGDPASAAGTCGRLRARIVINRTPVDVELLLPENDEADDPSIATGHPKPELRVQGRAYRVVGVFAIATE